MTLMLKDPAAELDYAIDWGRDYLEEDHLVRSDWAVDPDEPGGLSILVSDFDAARSRVKVGAGIAGRVYRLTNTVVTELARCDRRSLIVRVEAR